MDQKTPDLQYSLQQLQLCAPDRTTMPLHRSVSEHAADDVSDEAGWTHFRPNANLLPWIASDQLATDKGTNLRLTVFSNTVEETHLFSPPA